MTDADFQKVIAMLGALTAGVNRIADALENAQTRDEDQTVVLPLSDFHTFDWSTIGARVIYSDDDGVASVSGADGRIYKRRSNQKFGNDVWFSRGDGQNDDGTPNYKTLVHFVEMKPEDVQPLGRNVATAVSKAAPATPSQKAAEPPKTVAVPIAPTKPNKYTPSATERTAALDFLNYAHLLTGADNAEIARNTATIRAKFSEVCAAAEKRGLTCIERPANIAAAVKGIATMAQACIDFDKAQPEMALN